MDLLFTQEHQFLNRDLAILSQLQIQYFLLFFPEQYFLLARLMIQLKLILKEWRPSLTLYFRIMRKVLIGLTVHYLVNTYQSTVYYLLQT